jgi:hypothetical protein
MAYLSCYTGQAQTELFNRLGVFFAFSKEQFKEKKEPNVKYVDMGGGMLCPGDCIKELIEGLYAINKEGMAKDIEENGVEGIIRREYFNYESQITMDTSDARSKLSAYQDIYPDLFTDVIINQVFRECWDWAVDNDLF